MIRCKTSCHRFHSEQESYFKVRKREYDNKKAIEAYNIRKIQRTSKTPITSQKKLIFQTKPLTKMKFESQTPQISSKKKFFKSDITSNSSIFKNRIIQNKVPNISTFLSTFSSFNVNNQKFQPIKANSTKLSLLSPDIFSSKMKFWRNNPLILCTKKECITMPFYINSRLFYSPSHLEKIDTLEDSKTKLLKRTLNRKRIKAIRVGDFRTEKFEINQNKFKVNIVA